jgi:hypothetical protein
MMLQFLVASAIAMATYEGGNRVNSEAVGYSMVRNTFSDLGRTETYNERQSVLSRTLFTASLAVGGAGLVLYNALLPNLFRRSRLAAQGRVSPRVAGLISGSLGGVCGVAFIGIAVLPADVFPERHMLLVYVGFTVFLPAAIFGTLAFAASGGYSRRFVVPYAVLSVALVGYIVLIYFGPPVHTVEGNVIQVIGQKTIVYLGVACLTAQAWLCRQRLARRRRPLA